MPLGGFAIEATPDRPYLAFKLNLDPVRLCEIITQTTSPLQYQKQLRLLKARQLMLAENVDATIAAIRVGYNSSSQFSREYARIFGAPPIEDIKRLRIART